ncbi:histidine triad domain-containing protein [Campylobacter sputorum subsp. bubulus]|uniref:Histidine triad domain-containing protein n=1 Tax=Campylobacter sputorum subsp. sputorum TaxID=32024 RepID=A0A381DHL8_9BACT|nr:HIT domain-containing protein [Campylobacter sputorum]ASM35232.1 HIT family hydrolase, FHIT branch [Campylobacter sputorum aubsp. sputorum RM3237]KAB0580849.1 HIT domain-containing protein [Campylobacter sputorum subsp. sputorum]QEL05422.1 histidine triad nucleotide-binding protein, Fhit branch [Campylobacter sputorum subsp. sputorum]SUX08763.1 histidine triad domain-containing protein [Campylobacter sputorum subsp. bubulus]SUX10131.1 histidine triad domain-containing protein [Campylobacter
MNHLNAPWRSEYFETKSDDCVFCNIVKNPQKDDEFGVLFRAKHCFGVMNLYPYSPGHFMVIPYEHIDNIGCLDDETWFEMSLYVKLGVKILKEALNATGVNIGMNLGADAGAGICEHVHYHLVPRWKGDTNFITTISETRVAGVDFEKLYKKLKKAFSDLNLV